MEKAAFDALQQNIAVLDRKGFIVAVNAAWKKFSEENGGDPKFVGVGANYLEACSSSLWMPPDQECDVAGKLKALLKGQIESFTLEYPCETAGKKIWFLMSASALRRDGGGAVISHLEITECYLEEAALREGHALFSELVEGMTDAVFLCDPSGCFILANGAMGALLGKPPDSIIGKQVADMGKPEIARMVLDQNAAVQARGESRTYETKVATEEGVRTFLMTKGVHQGCPGGAHGVFGIARDITALKAMEREVIETSDKEKQRFSYELHENLCQVLVGISLLSNALDEELLRLGLKQSEDARQITALAKEAVVHVRSLVKELSTMPAQEDGLIAALEDLASRTATVSNIKCTFQKPRRTKPIDADASMHLFRIAQEATHNAVKHSGATKIAVKLAVNRSAVTLSIQDNGVGFPESNPPYSKIGSGLGIHIMHYRSRAIGAELEIRKLAGKGTAVVCTVPIAD